MQTNMLTVAYPDSRTPVASVAFSAFESAGNAEPTSRLLDGSDDHGYAEEWAEPGHVVIDGERRRASLIWLFTADEVSDETDAYPWDEDHAARIVLRD